ncbi:MAG: DUF7948 domain-containing protein [Candidatus Thorarchaeota archaeon]
MSKSRSFDGVKPVITICLLLIAGSIVMISYDGTAISSDSEVVDEFTIRENAQQAIQSQFYENLGQVQNSAIRFYGDISGLGIGFTDSSVIYRLSSAVSDSTPKNLQCNTEPTIVTLSFEGANDVTPYGNGLLSHKSNYFIGDDPSEWYIGVRGYSEIVYPNLYDHIDLIYRVSEKGLKYEFVVQPGGNPVDINIGYNGIDTLTIDGEGSLVADTSLGQLIDRELYIYQDTESGREEVAGQFVMSIEDDCGFGFQITADYSEDLPLVIDPFLQYSTFVGGTSEDRGYSIVLDSSNNVYVTGHTFSSGFPTTLGANDTSYNVGGDVFILKLSADGSTLLYSTFVGGTSFDYGKSIALDSSNNVYVTGYTESSTGFPTTPGANDTTHNGGSDVFILKLSADGSTLLYSTFVGGSGSDYGDSISLDSSNNAYVTGHTGSSNFPTTLGANDTSYDGGYDGFILKLSADGSTLLYSTFVGGSGYDSGYSIAIDTSNNAYVTGYTSSDTFPTTSGAYNVTRSGSYDVFILKLSADGSTLLYSTFVGGSIDDYGYSIVLDSSNNAYVTGETGSSDFPTTPTANDTSFNDGFYDGFILKLSADGSTLLYSTFFGGTSFDHGYSIVLDNSNNAYVTGATSSDNYPTTSGAYNTTRNGNRDVFILNLSADGSTI